MKPDTAGQTRKPPVGYERRGIAAFLAIAFGLAWLPFAPALAGRDPVGMVLMPFAPAVAAVVVRRWITCEGFRDAGLRPNPRRWRFYLLAVVWPMAATLLSVPVAIVLRVAPSGFALPWGVATPRPLTVLAWAVGSIALAPIVFGEELGWRGYLQVRLFANRPLRAAVATGLIWGVWHYPLILVGGEETAGRLQTLLLLPVATTTMSVFLGWLRARTGEVWAGSVAHAANNATEDSWHRLAFTGRADGVPAASSNVAAVIAEALVLLGIVATDHLVRRRLDQSDASGRPASIRVAETANFQAAGTD